MVDWEKFDISKPENRTGTMRSFDNTGDTNTYSVSTSDGDGNATVTTTSWDDGQDMAEGTTSTSTITSGSSGSSSSGSSDSSSSGNPTTDELKEYHETWGDTTTSFEDAAGPSYEEQIASEIISSGGASLDYLEQDITRLPNTTLEGVRQEFQNMISGGSSSTSDAPTNEAAAPSIPSLPSLSADSLQSAFGGVAGLVIGLIVLAVVFLTPGDR